MTVTELAESAGREAAPRASLSPEARALWHAKKGNWRQAHEIAQEIHTPLGSWIHALLHVIEGDHGNAGYWFRQAGRAVRGAAEIEALWEEIAAEVLES